MTSIPDDLLMINAADPDGLTRLLDLPDLQVTRLERAAWLPRLVLHCTVTTTEAPCPRCQFDSTAIHQYERRTPRDLPWAGCACYLQITARRFWCSYCQRPFSEVLAAVAPAARTTRRYAAHLVAQVRTANIAATARTEQPGYKAVEGIFYRAAAAAHPEGPPAELVRRVGIDEIATRKGHGHFQVVISDLDRGRVLAQLADRRQETLREYLASWSAEQRAGVEEGATDFWAAYHTVAQEVFPQARVVGDRFHVQQHLTEAVGATRRAVAGRLGAEDAAFGRTWKDVLVRNEEDLPAADWAALIVMKGGVPELERVHTLKEEFRAIFEAPLERAAAAAQLEEWLGRAWTSGLGALEKFAAFVERWRESILNYFVRRTSSGRVEGLNNKIKLLMRQAFGFGNDAHFRLRVLVACDGRA